MSSSRRPLRSAAATLAGVLILLAIFAPAANAQVRRATVTTHDGQQLTGEFVSQDDKRVVLRIAGIETPIDRASVAGVEMLKTPAQEYAQRRAALADDDVDGRYALALWLFDQNELQLAQQELADLTAQAPRDQKVAMLANLVSERIKLQESAPAPAPGVTPGVTPGAAPGAAATTPSTPAPGSSVTSPAATPDEQTPADLPTQKLTEEQISMIKLYELPMDFTRMSPKPIIVVPRDVVEEMIDKYRDNELIPKGRTEQTALRRASAIELLDLIFRLQAREFYPRITVRTESPSLTAFKTRVHNNYVLPYCASNQCHGGTQGGDLFLFRSQPASDPTFYTNFYLLHRYQTANGFMLDRDRPTDALLIQYGMRREDAKFPHPDVPGYRPEFRLPNDPRIALMAQAIGDLYKPRPDYGITYNIPPSSKPASSPPSP